MSEGMKPGVWDQLKRRTPEAILAKKESDEPFLQFATRFDRQAEDALRNARLVGSIQSRMRDIDRAFGTAMSGGNDREISEICDEIAKKNPMMFPDTIEDPKERAAYVLAVANQMITQVPKLN